MHQRGGLRHPVMKLALVALLGVLLLPVGAQALPAFARKHGLSCSACHEVWPRLNEFGERYRDEGYRLRNGRDAPVEQSPGYWPLAMRTTAGYQWLRNTLVDSRTGPVTTQTGAFGFTGLDAHAAGTLGERISFLVTYTPGLSEASFRRAPSESALESVWVGFPDLFGSGWLNLRVGKHALDLPVDEHRQVTLTTGYASYHFTLPGSSLGFSPGDNQAGLELYGHSEQSRVRWSLSLVNEGAAPLSNHAVSTPTLWAHATGRHVFDSGPLAAAKVGLFGSVGWHPTVLSLSPAGDPLPGSGSSLARHGRVGGELHLYLLDRFFPLTITSVLTVAREDRALTPGATTAGT